MKRKMIAILLMFALTVTFAACGEEEKETTLTGMVVSVDGTVISLMEMDADNMGGMGGMNFGSGERPQMPEGMEGMEGFEGFGDFDPENFDGTFPEGGDFSQWGDGEMPQMPGGMNIPEDMTMPEGMTMPENGERPDFGGMGGMDFSNISSDAETKDVDIGDAHISVEIDGGKASGSLEDIKAGTFVTITMNSKGEVTNVLVSSSSSFGGGRGSTN